MRSVKRTAAAVAAAAIAILTAVTLVGCGGSGLSGSLTLAGSTTVQPVAQEAADQMMEKNSGLNITVQGGGSSVGITQVSEGAVDIGMSSRDLKPEEESLGLDDTKIALDIICAIVNPGTVTVTNLSKDQLKDIFLGNIKDWSEVGGKAGAIKVVIRDEASGTREKFDETILGSKKDNPVKPVSGAEETNSNGVMRQKVSSTDFAIGYISKGYADKSVKVLSIDGVEPTTSNATGGEYILSRYLHLFTKGAPEGNAKAYIDYVLSPEFQEETVAREYIPIDEATGGSSTPSK